MTLPSDAVVTNGPLCHYQVKSDETGCDTVRDFARGARMRGPFPYVGESEDCGKYVGKLLERR